MSKIQGAKIDMYEHLPVPFGLVRFGVAPDHPEVKVGSTIGYLILKVALLLPPRFLLRSYLIQESIELPRQV